MVIDVIHFQAFLLIVRESSNDFPHEMHSGILGDGETGHVSTVANGPLAVKPALAPQACHASGLGRKKREFGSLTEFKLFLQEQGRIGGKIGGKIAAKQMTKAARTARAKKAAAASAKVRTAKAKARKKGRA